MTAARETHDADPMRLRSTVGGLALTGPLSIHRVARHLGTSPRSLQRRLAGQNTTFRQLVDAVRLDMARVLLRETDLAVGEVARRLGYRTPSGFARAFARWTGRSPRAFRRTRERH
jgi:AraC-like DNA-binding protein